MANFNKKWGAVIACWCVALVMIITGVCLGLTIPSSAAGENVLMVTVGDEVTYYKGFDDSKLNEYLTNLVAEMTEKQTIEITLLGDTHCSDERDFPFYATEDLGCDWVLDLNGHVCSFAGGVYFVIREDYNFTIKDSNPTVTRYCVREGTSGNYTYLFPTKLADGEYGTGIKGGVLISAQTIVDNSGMMTFTGGNYYGRGGIQNNMTGKLILNDVNWQVYTDMEEDYVSGRTGLVNSGSVEINGLNTKIHGQVVDFKIIDDDNYIPKVVELDAVPEDSNIKLGEGVGFMADTDVDGVKVYTAVDAITGKPITTPTEPIAEAEQLTNNNNALIGLIILGAAAAVMVVGVTVIIMVNAKRRKKVA